MTPLLKMNTLGHDFMPPPYTRWPALSRHVSSGKPVARDGIVEARSYHQTKVFESALLFAQSEGIVPAPESSHAIRAAVEEAEAARETGEKKVILFNLSGHGLLDLPVYDRVLAGDVQDV